MNRLEPKASDDQAGLVANEEVNDFMDVPGMLEISEVGMSFKDSTATIGHNFTFQGPVTINQRTRNTPSEHVRDGTKHENIVPEPKTPDKPCHVIVTNPLEIQVFTVPVPAAGLTAGKYFLLLRRFWWIQC